MSLTGGFDAVLRIAPAAVSDACVRAHAGGSVTHGQFVLLNGAAYSIAIGAPAIAVQVPSADGRCRVVASTNALLRKRLAGDPGDAGVSATAAINYRVAFQSPAGTIGPESVLLTDPSETTVNDVLVQTTDANFAADIASTVVDAAGSNNSRGSIFLGGLARVGVRAIAVDGNRCPDGSVGIAIGLDLGGGAGNLDQADAAGATSWSLALSRDLVLRNVVASLKRQLGALPPPYGTTTVVVDDRQICILATPIGCMATARRTITIDTLSIDLSPAGISLSGDLAVQVGGLLPSTSKATFASTVTISLTAQGDLATTVGPVTVTLTSQDVIGAVEGFLTGTDTTTALREGMSATLSGDLANGSVSDVLDDLLTELSRASPGSVAVRATGVQLSTDGILVFGDIAAAALQGSVVANLSAIADLSAPPAVLLNAGGSWAPGSEIASATFQPGDGTTISLAGQNLSLATRHVYAAAGRYAAQVTLTALNGASHSASCQLEAGVLRLNLLNGDGGVADGSQICTVPGAAQVVLAIGVTAGNRPAPGISVTVNGVAGWQASGITDANGRATIQADPSRATPPGAGAPMFALGFFTATANPVGWTIVPTKVWVVNCGAIGDLRRLAELERQRILDRLAEYTELAHIRDSLGLTPSLPGIDPRLSLNASLDPPVDPRIQDAGAIGLALNAVDGITNLFIGAGAGLPVNEILGLSQSSPPQVALKKLVGLWNAVGLLAAQYQQRYGPVGGGVDQKPS